MAHLKELGKHDVILEAFTANAGVVLDGEAKQTVGTALLSVGRFREALEQFVNAAAISELGDLAAAASASAEREVAEKAIRLCAILIVQHSHWASVREYLNSGNLPKASKEAQRTLAPILDEIRLQFDRLLAASLARSDTLTKLDSGEQKPISKFLRNLERSKYWQTRISVQELGAAIERSQRFVDAVEFYESMLRSVQTDDEFAIVRWIKSKERLEVFYRGEKQYRRADEIREEITKVKDTLPRNNRHCPRSAKSSLLPSAAHSSWSRCSAFGMRLPT